MKCPNHPQNEATGYCGVCAAFGCAECLSEHEGVLYCARHFKPFARKLEDEKRHEDARRRRPRQRLVVRFLDGRRAYGVCYAFNIKSDDFVLDMVDGAGNSLGKTETVSFKDLKAIFLVKSFDGKFDPTVAYPEWKPEGAEVVIEFEDGELLRGFSLRAYNPEEARFYIVPAEREANNIAILVERDAVVGAYTLEEYREKVRQERESAKEDGAAADLSQEETTGDFYFQTRNYRGALERYRAAQQKFPQSRRVRKKILMTEYNVAIDHIKRHQYAEALEMMESIHKVEPRNPRVQRKIMQLRKIMEKEGRTGE